MKIGFLALSGVRACDQELLKLGLTLPGFVSRSRVIASLPSLGLLYLAATTPEGHELRYFEAEGAGKEEEALYSCDLVAISTFSAQANEAYQIADSLRAREITVAMGGLHVSVCPDEAKRHADHVIVGEGENVWKHVVKAVEQRAPGRIWQAKDYGRVDLQTLPVPRYDLLQGRPYNRFTVQTSRGCPWRCDFCASSVMLSLNYRKRPVAAVIRDIIELKRLFGRPFLEFADDNTFVDKRWGKELLRALIPLQVKWFTETDISVADDSELLTLMAESGCRQVLIGLESPGQSALQGIEMKANFKAQAAPRYQAAIKKIQAAGITVNGCFILGLKNQTPEVFQNVLSFARDAGLYEVQVTVLTPFPGTPLYSRLKAEGRLIMENDWSRCTLFDVNFVPQQMTPEQLREGLYWLTEKLYSQEETEKRRRKFFKNLKRKTKDVGLTIEDETLAA